MNSTKDVLLSDGLWATRELLHWCGWQENWMIFVFIGLKIELGRPSEILEYTMSDMLILQVSAFCLQLEYFMHGEGGFSTIIVGFL